MNLDFSDIKILLIGDFMIDHYIFGVSNRMSPEAPVPVVKPEREYSIPGGAGNVAMNLSLLGADVTCVGTVGDDVWGQKLLSILNNEGINTELIEVIGQHLTTLKQRIYSNKKQVARLDTEKIKDYHPSKEYHEKIENLILSSDVIILSDYNKGVISSGWWKTSRLDLHQVFIDPKSDDFSIYKNKSLSAGDTKKSHILTPNLNELKRASNIDINDDKSIIDACNKLIKENSFEYIVVKKGSQGMTIVGNDNFVKHIEAHHVENPDVTGAGDTVISVLSLSYIQTKDIEISAKIANTAAAIVVGKPGTATVTVQEIEQLLNK